MHKAKNDEFYTKEELWEMADDLFEDVASEANKSDTHIDGGDFIVADDILMMTESGVKFEECDDWEFTHPLLKDKTVYMELSGYNPTPGYADNIVYEGVMYIHVDNSDYYYAVDYYWHN